MVATDIAARGIDVTQISHVINFDIPDTPEAYTHRIGRTGRMLRKGLALTFVTPEDRSILRSIERYLGKPIERMVPIKAAV
jgi:ATP-dependent RNA helicase RhlE